ncbi:60-kDa SS-A/Ro ribonucleoprotein-like [Planctomycetales bacterium 10988]|nr:60-kDa SS-A/Ro ribonucleoprotein-like [Planctomycetales bacterium 10988]
MANQELFSSMQGKHPRADARNKAGGRAYRLSPKHALAQLASTGCFNGVYYASAQSQLDDLFRLIQEVDDVRYLAKLAVYSRERAFMKDMPAALVLEVAKRDPALMHVIFDRVVDNGRVLRTLFQMIRSGQFGRKGLSSSLQRAFQRWLNEASVGKLLSASIGHHPSLRDVLRMARPTPKDNVRRAVFGWLTDKDVEKWTPASMADLPFQVQTLLKYREAEDAETQVALLNDLSVRWDLLADAAVDSSVWKAIARQMGPQALRMNLNTLLRHEVFGVGKPDKEMVEYVAGRLSDAEEIRRSRQFPYQYFAAYMNADPRVPQKIKSALHQAAEIACENVPILPGPVVIGLDVSGSMNYPVTGYRGRGASSKMRCVDVAALIAAAILRRNSESIVVPFDTRSYVTKMDPNDSILSLSERLSHFGGGGTDCSLPLQTANTTFRKSHFAGVILVSDTESWLGNGRYGSTGVMTEWEKFIKNQRKQGDDISPKLICINLQPYGTSQAPEREEILNIGGFSDAIFQVIAAHLSDDANRFVSEVEAIEL